MAKKRQTQVWCLKPIVSSKTRFQFSVFFGLIFSLAGLSHALAATNCTLVTEIPEAECETLLDIYNSTNGANWSDSPDNDWNVTDTPCDWSGITCDGGHVNGIVRENQALVGTIPDLSALTNLTRLYLSRNKLTGPIPDLTELTNLEKLYLNNNQLSGPIPDLTQLTRLSWLYLNENQLSGSIPDLSRLTDLLSVHLENNQFSGEIPNMDNLFQLRYLYLNHNQLSGLIPYFSENLEKLYLNNNQLTGEIPSSLTYLTELSKLDLGHNQLTASDAEVRSFVDEKDPDWFLTQGKTLLTCGDGTGSVSVNPPQLDFGSEAIGDSLSLSISTRAVGCGALQIDTLDFTGNNGSEFSVKNQKCHDGQWQGQIFSACQFSLVFSPTSEGSKDARMNFTFNDANVQSGFMPLIANAVQSGQPNLEVFPTTHDFGMIMLDKGPFETQAFTVKNTGSVNLKFDSMTLTGADTEDFAFSGDCAHQTFLPPDEQCPFSIQFTPTLTLGNKQANVNIAFNATSTVEVPLTGIVAEPVDCSEDHITIASSGDGIWASTDTWKRFRPLDELGTPSTPTKMDVVQIKNGHTVTGIRFTQLRALCLEEGGTLLSPDDQGTPLIIDATDYIENKGIIKGQEGAESQPGADIFLSTGNGWWSGEPLRNEGTIIAGNGGDGERYAGRGGSIHISGSVLTNTPNEEGTGGIILAGQGGNIIGIESGRAGQGGGITMWGSESLQHQGDITIAAGAGGNGNPTSTATQRAGNGGKVGLNAQLRVHLRGGTFSAGKGGTNASIEGTDGKVYIDPGRITLSAVKINGGDIAIYGGEDWTLDLSHSNGTEVTATGDITLAVGEGGRINLRGNTSRILQSAEQVRVFSDQVLMDEEVALSDLIQANNLMIGPSRIVREASLIGPSNWVGEPESTLAIEVKLVNESPQPDTYTLSVTDSAGWTISPLPPTIEVDGLGAVDLVLNVSLPATRGAADILTVTATSQTDSNVSTSAELQVAVALVDTTGDGTTGDDATGDDTDGTVIDFPIPTIPNCPTTGVISEICKNHGQVITDASVEKGASMAGGILAGTVNNQGFISQATIQSGAIVSGGKLTGSILNEGTLVNFEFVGASVIGGTLSGTIINNSRVGGFFKEVQLAANTHIIGGALAGHIQGDCDSLARLDNLTIQADSHIDCVMIGDGVNFAEGVTRGEGVRFVNPSDNPQTEPNLPIAPPTLRGAVAINRQGEVAETEAIFAGGTLVNEEGRFDKKVTVSREEDWVDMSGRISFASEHVEQPADILVVVVYWPNESASSTLPRYFMLDENRIHQPWDGQIASLVPFQTDNPTAEPIDVSIFQGFFKEIVRANGKLNIYLGYRPTAETMVVYSPESLEVIITE